MSTTTVTRSFGLLRFCALVPLLASHGCGSSDAPDMHTAVAHQALNGSPPPMCIFGALGVRIGNAAQVHSDVGSNNSVEVQAGWATQDTLVVGDITSANTVALYGGNSHVSGTVRANSTVTQQAGATADHAFQNVVPPLPQHTVIHKAVQPGSTDVWIQDASCHGTVLSPNPNQYGTVAVRPGCDLTLTAGEYHFRRLDIDTEATLIVQGPVKIRTEWDFRFADRAVLQGVVDPYDLDVYSDYQVTIGNNVADFRGMLTAKWIVAVASSSNVTGCMQANYVTIDPGSVHHNAGHIPGRNRRALMEVELSSPSFDPTQPSPTPCPPTVRLRFAEGRHQGSDYPVSVVELGNPSFVAPSNNCIYGDIVDQLPLAICENQDHPCVHHPDQWDDVSISWGGVSSIPLDGIRVTNFEAVSGTEGPSGPVGPYYNLVYTPGTAINDGLFTGVPHSYEQDSAGVPIIDTRNDVPAGLSIGPSYYSLRDMIQWRRERVTEWIIWNAYTRNYANAFPNAVPEDADFDALPLIVREGSHDQGQVGDFKHAGDKIYEGGPLACSGTQTFYESNYSEGYQADFLHPWGAPLHRYECSFDPLTLQHHCFNGVGTWPNPPHPFNAASLNTWGDEVDVRTPANPAGRALAKAVFTQTPGPGGVPVNSGHIVEFRLVDAVNAPPGQNSWNTTATTYEPKPGDFFWRFDRCWHGGGIRHAMVLVGDPYADGALPVATTRFSAPMLDGSSMIRIRDYDFSTEADVNVWGAFHHTCTRGVECDCDGPNGAPDGVPEAYDCSPAAFAPEGETGVTYAAAITAAEAPLPAPPAPAPPPATCVCSGRRPLMCPAGVGVTEPRYEYYVGESYSPNEFFVYSHKHDSKPFDWSVVSEGLITQPSFDATQPHNHPVMADLGFGRIDDDSYEDIVWKRADDSVWVALSADDYAEWHSTGVPAPFEVLLTLDIGHLNAVGDPLNVASDGRADLVGLAESGGQIIVRSVLNHNSSPTAFDGWYLVDEFPSLGNDVAWWAEHLRFADFNADGVTDILRAVNGAWEINFRNGTPNWQGNFGDVASYQFADLDYDGRTDIATYNGAVWQWTSLTAGGWWSAWVTFNADFNGCGIGDVRFVNWDGDAPAMGTVRADMFCLSGMGDWQVVLDHDPANVLSVHARADSVDSLAFGNFKTVGDATDNNELLDDVLYFGSSPIEHIF